MRTFDQNVLLFTSPARRKTEQASAFPDRRRAPVRGRSFSNERSPARPLAFGRCGGPHVKAVAEKDSLSFSAPVIIVALRGSDDRSSKQR